MNVLGIDIGSVAISAAVLNRKKEIVQTSYQFHHGAIRETLLEMLKHVDVKNLVSVSVTSSTPEIIKSGKKHDTQMSVITAVKHFHSDVGSILIVGGENFGLITFNSEGEYESYKTNSSCAAGTGSFLDQQAERLNLKSIEMLSNVAFCNEESSPKIATRCAVFAKTDLIHAQQEGYSVGQISDGLCEGLAKNIIDTLIPDDVVRTPFIFAGGVSTNQGVVKHFRRLLGAEPIVGEWSNLYGAIGAAIMELDNGNFEELQAETIEDILHSEKIERHYGYEPLALNISSYPDFSSLEKYEFTPNNRESVAVEVDIYKKIAKQNEVYLGIDIGSTSTKAVIMNRDNIVVAGFYTRTAGAPIDAVRNIFESIADIEKSKNSSFSFLGVGTTGSGRKFIGKVINADLMVDEITAHARAAYDLDPEVDTVIEIGGQDAKFTTMKDGIVNSSVMNNVCAAGTGSFIEEQSLKLGTAITDYTEKALGTKAPIASDRCTVFMERDINHYLSEGFSVDEVLASVLHSVRENYLAKVAVEAHIGEKICFQGATAKNRALVAAFEQKLEKPIFVSKYCHLTGALGSALILSETEVTKSGFRGISIYNESIPIISEVCELCHNSCKIKKVTVQDETVSFGFLCGRDPGSKKAIPEKEKGFNLLAERRKAFRRTIAPRAADSEIVMGIPSALYLSEESILWEHFFNTLGVKTFSSRNMKDPIKIGKKVAGSEFCAPISSFHGHVKELAEKADYLFLPVYLESPEKDKESQRSYCYYTQFAASLASKAKGINLEDKAVMPLIEHKPFLTKMELYKALRPVIGASYWSISAAYEHAMDYYRSSKSKLKKIYDREREKSNDVDILLLGRPYTVLENNMNKRIPGIFADLGIKCFYQDMLSYSKENVEEINPLLKAIHWHYSAKILEAALIASKRDGLYPVLITSFKCGPDSFSIEYFKRIMDEKQKPYLILELDEHDSSVGYETRIEAAIRSFRNHFERKQKLSIAKNLLPVNPEINKKLEGKTLLLPSWDNYTFKLIEAVFIKEGIDARMVPLTEEAVKVGPRTNTGQCIPVNIIIRSFIDYIEQNKLDPETTAVWAFDASFACNVKMYPYFIKSMLESYGKGMGKVIVYLGELSLTDISIQASIDTYFAYMLGGMLRKIGCKIRPYEKEKGMTDKQLDEAVKILYTSFLGNRSREDDIAKIVSMFKKIETIKEDRPKVAIFGDIYARDNEVMNQNLIRSIEEAGGEVITTPFSDLVKMVLDPYMKRWLRQGYYKDIITGKAIIALVSYLEKSYHKYFNEILEETPQKYKLDMDKIAEPFNVKVEHSGESMDNLIKINALKEHYPDISLFVQTNPGFCCAGHITEAMSAGIEETTEVPIVSLTYDGTGKYQNDKLIPYIKYASSKLKRKRSS